MLDKIPNWLKNKYAVTGLFFIIWLLFFDQSDIITQYGEYRSQLKELRNDKEFYTKEILKTRKELEELTTNPKTLEKFAREKYFMKKKDEEIFIITEKK